MLACNSFGQTINVNMMQMMSAYCSIINGGMLYQPHIVKRIESANGEVVKENKATLVRQTDYYVNIKAVKKIS